MSQQDNYPDIIRPGDPNFTSFPKHLAEDCVAYTIHILTCPPLSVAATRSRLLEIKRSAKALCESLLSGYIWQRDDFTLELFHSGTVGLPDSKDGDEASETTGALPRSSQALEGKPTQLWHLSGRTCFGDSIADEWLIVYLLRETSKQFKDAWIRIVDSDGEFLLVEAAMVLPKWLNPEIAEHRVWINQGQLRVIPRELAETPSTSKITSGKSTVKSTRPVPRELSLSDALLFISLHMRALIHSPLIEEEAFYRIRNYPEAISESMHTAIISIPRNLAFLLHEYPAYISAAVDAFYLRDPISLRSLQGALSNKSRFPPSDFVTTSITFTRVGYAQLKGQNFTPPATWTSALRNVERTTEWTKREMGMKVACGFEMLLADPQNKDQRSVREIEILLEEIANGDETLPSDADITSWPQKEDDERWLDVNFEDFEKELSGRKGTKPNTDGDGVTAGFGDKSAQENLRKMVERFEKFLNDDEAGIDGAELSDEMDYDNDDDDDDDENYDLEESDDPEEDRDASFDEDEFANMMRQMMGMPNKDTVSGIITPTSKRVQELDSDADSGVDSDGGDLETVTKCMEAELREAGALDSNNHGVDGEDDIEDHRYQLAKNLLESFKGQVGTAGPTGNMMNSMGFRLPRHEEVEEEER